MSLSDGFYTYQINSGNFYSGKQITYSFGEEYLRLYEYNYNETEKGHYLHLPCINEPSESSEGKAYLNLDFRNLNSNENYIMPSIIGNIGLNTNNFMDSNRLFLNNIFLKGKSGEIYSTETITPISTTDTFYLIIDATYVQKYKFYNVYCICFKNTDISSISDYDLDPPLSYRISPTVFVCDMEDQITGAHSDGAFVISHDNHIGYSGNFISGICLNNWGNQIEYQKEDFKPQLYTDQDNSIEIQPIQFGRWKSNNIYITNASKYNKLQSLCDVSRLAKNYNPLPSSSKWEKNWGWHSSLITEDKAIVLGFTSDKKYNYSDSEGDYAPALVVKKPKLVSWSEGTDEEITDMINAYYMKLLTLEEIKSVWKIGDKRKVHISEIGAFYALEKHREQDVEMAIIGFNDDWAEDDGYTYSVHSIYNKVMNEECLMTIQQKDCLMDEECAAGLKDGKYNTENGAMHETIKMSGGKIYDQTWKGLTNFYGKYIWKTETTVYYSYGNQQYELDEITNTWKEKTWKGLTNFNGNNVWSWVGSWFSDDWDTTFYYYSEGTNKQYILDEKTGTWKKKTWQGYNNLYGENIWKGNTQHGLFYSAGTIQYELVDSKTTQIWNKVNWKKKVWNSKTQKYDILFWSQSDLENFYGKDVYNMLYYDFGYSADTKTIFDNGTIKASLAFVSLEEDIWYFDNSSSGLGRYHWIGCQNEYYPTECYYSNNSDQQYYEELGDGFWRWQTLEWKNPNTNKIINFSGENVWNDDRGHIFVSEGTKHYRFTNVTGYSFTSSSRINWCNRAYYPALPKYLQDLVKEVSIYHAYNVMRDESFSTKIFLTGPNFGYYGRTDERGNVSRWEPGWFSEFKYYYGKDGQNWNKTPYAYWTGGGSDDDPEDPSDDDHLWDVSAVRNGEIEFLDPSTKLGIAPAMCL